MTSTLASRAAAQVLLLQPDDGRRASAAMVLRTGGWQVQPLPAWPAGDALPPHDLLFLDAALPGAWQWLARRPAEAAPVIVLLGERLAAPEARVLALELGAEAVIDWPWHPRELVLRAGAALRRTLARPRAEAPLGGARLDLATRRLQCADGAAVALSVAEARLLAVFLDRPGLVLDREALLTLARGRGVDQLDRSIDLLVSRLRRKLAAASAGEACIRTVRGAGYCLEAGVGVKPET